MVVEEDVSKFNILVVEDNNIIGVIMQNMFAMMDCNTTIAKNGKEALELFNKGDFNLILMDIGLPDSDGFTLSKKIRASDNPRKANIPIVILTAHSTVKSYVNEIEELSIKDFIVKPCTLEMCNQLIAKYRVGYSPTKVV